MASFVELLCICLPITFRQVYHYYFNILAKKSWDGVWIGLNDRQSESRFQWSDGTDVKYTKWDVGEPNSWRNHNEDCVEVYLNVRINFASKIKRV